MEMEVDIIKEKTVSVVYKGIEVVIYEGGWWIKRGDYDRLLSASHPNWFKVPISYCIDRNERTRQLTLSLLPPF